MSTQPNLGMQEHSDSEKWVAATLYYGSYGSFTLLLIAGMLSVVSATWSIRLATAGVLLMLATPALRLVVTLIHFSYLKEWKYALVCAALLTIITLATFMGINLH